MTDIYSTANCPVGARCERCGDSTAELAAHTAKTPAGVLCLTLCPVCARAGDPPRLMWPTAIRLVGEHCLHLHIDVDRMAELMKEQRSGQ